MVQPQGVTFDELSARLREYERQYGHSTIEFYRRYENGEMGDSLFWHEGAHACGRPVY
jgi:hypothetical protein